MPVNVRAFQADTTQRAMPRTWMTYDDASSASVAAGDPAIGIKGTFVVSTAFEGFKSGAGNWTGHALGAASIESAKMTLFPAPSGSVLASLGSGVVSASSSSAPATISGSTTLILANTGTSESRGGLSLLDFTTTPRERR